MPVLDEKKHIEISAELSGGRPRIAGTRVRVQDVVACHEFQGMTADEIVSGYPQLTLGDVSAALAYYHDHRDQIHAQMKEDEEFVSHFRHQYQQASHSNDTHGPAVSP